MQTVNLALLKSFGAHAAEAPPFAAPEPSTRSALKAAACRRMGPCRRCLNFPIAVPEAPAPSDLRAARFMRRDIKG